jgi:dCMP deaminase
VTFVRPSEDETLLRIAETMAMRGTCSRARVGAVFALRGRVLATGYNGAPGGMPHCEHPPSELTATRPADRPTCAVAVHAEANAVAFAARHGVALEGAALYTTLSPCVVCAQLVINAGVRDVYVQRLYRDPTGVELLESAGVRVRCWVDVHGIFVTSHAVERA